MLKVLYYLLQFTWGILQNFAGLVGFLVLHRNHEWEKYHNSFITYVEADNFGGVSLGCFIFINPARTNEWRHDTRIHEYGHTWQSLLLGPLYFFVVGIPSAVWCNTPVFVKLRKEKGYSYYKLYCECWANIWGRAASKESFLSDDLKEHGYFGRPIKPARFELKAKERSGK